MNRTYHSLVLAGAMALAGTETFAQTQAQSQGQTQPQTLSPIRIEVPAPAQSLTQPTAEQAKQKIEQVPGGVDLVPAEEFRDGRAVTLKDALDYVPGVFIQPKFGEDSRLSIRGSGLARNFHLRGVKLLQDGVPEAYYVDNANTTRTASYALLGLKTGYNDPAGWSLFIDGRNLTDERHIASASVSASATPASAVFEPGFGRAVYAGVQVRW